MPVIKTKRWPAPRTLVLLLFGGAVVNILVAWGCVLAEPHLLSGLRGVRVDASSEAIYGRRGLRVTGLDSKRSWGLTEAVVAYWNPAHNDPETRQRRSFASCWRAGWPLRAFACTVFDNQDFEGGLFVPDFTTNLDRVKSPRNWPLPYKPEWPGLVINTTLYAAVLASGLVGFRWLRPRRGPGACRTCGYDLSGNVSSICPECGAKV